MSLRIVKYDPAIHGEFETRDYAEPPKEKHLPRMGIRPHADLDTPSTSLDKLFRLALSGNDARPALTHEHLRNGWRIAADGFSAYLIREGAETDSPCPICAELGHTCPTMDWLADFITAPDSKFVSVSTVSAIPLIRACNRAMAFAVDVANTMRLSVNSTLKYVAISAEVGHVAGEIADGDKEQDLVRAGRHAVSRWVSLDYHYSHTGEAMVIGVNAVSLAQAVNFMIAPNSDLPKKYQKRAELVTIRLTSPTSPIVLTCSEHPERGAVVMPMFLSR